jgi:hypothetical protein
MAQLRLLELAKQGDPQAIAALMNQSLQPKGMTALVERQGDALEVILQADRVPNRQALTEFVEKGIHNLGIKSIRSVRILGKQTDSSFPAWMQELHLVVSSHADLADPIAETNIAAADISSEADASPESQVSSPLSSADEAPLTASSLEELVDPVASEEPDDQPELQSTLADLWAEQTEEQSQDFLQELMLSDEPATPTSDPLADLFAEESPDPAAQQEPLSDFFAASESAAPEPDEFQDFFAAEPEASPESVNGLQDFFAAEPEAPSESADDLQDFFAAESETPSEAVIDDFLAESFPESNESEAVIDDLFSEPSPNPATPTPDALDDFFTENPASSEAIDDLFAASPRTNEALDDSFDDFLAASTEPDLTAPSADPLEDLFAETVELTSDEQDFSVADLLAEELDATEPQTLPDPWSAAAEIRVEPTPNNLDAADSVEPIENFFTTSEPASTEEPIEDLFAASEPALDEEPIEDFFVTSEPALTEEPIEDLFAASEPASTEEPIEDFFVTSEPALTEEPIEDFFAASEPVSEEPIEDLFAASEPALTEEPIEDFFVTSEPALTEEPIEDLFAASEPASTEEPIEDFFVTSEPALTEEPIEDFFAASEPALTEEPIEDLFAASEPALDEEPIEDFFVTSEPASIEEPIEDLFAASEPASTEEPIEDFFVTSEPALTEEPIEDLFAASEPALDEEPIEDFFVTSEPASTEEPIEDLFAASEPALDEEPIEDFFVTSEPALTEEPIEDFFVTSEPASTEEPIEDLFAASEPTSTEEPIEDLFAASEPVSEEPIEDFFTTSEPASTEEPIEDLFTASEPALTEEPIEDFFTNLSAEQQEEVLSAEQPDFLFEEPTTNELDFLDESADPAQTQMDLFGEADRFDLEADPSLAAESPASPETISPIDDFFPTEVEPEIADPQLDLQSEASFELSEFELSDDPLLVAEDLAGESMEYVVMPETEAESSLDELFGDDSEPQAEPIDRFDSFGAPAESLPANESIDLFGQPAEPLLNENEPIDWFDEQSTAEPPAAEDEFFPPVEESFEEFELTPEESESLMDLELGDFYLPEELAESPLDQADEPLSEPAELDAPDPVADFFTDGTVIPEEDPIADFLMQPDAPSESPDEFQALIASESEMSPEVTLQDQWTEPSESLGWLSEPSEEVESFAEQPVPEAAEDWTSDQPDLPPEASLTDLFAADLNESAIETSEAADLPDSLTELDEPSTDEPLLEQELPFFVEGSFTEAEQADFLALPEADLPELALPPAELPELALPAAETPELALPEGEYDASLNTPPEISQQQLEAQIENLFAEQSDEVNEASFQEQWEVQTGDPDWGALDEFSFEPAAESDQAIDFLGELSTESKSPLTDEPIDFLSEPSTEPEALLPDESFDFLGEPSTESESPLTDEPIDFLGELSTESESPLADEPIDFLGEPSTESESPLTDEPIDFLGEPSTESESSLTDEPIDFLGEPSTESESPLSDESFDFLGEPSTESESSLTDEPIDFLGEPSTESESPLSDESFDFLGEPSTESESSLTDEPIDFLGEPSTESESPLADESFDFLGEPSTESESPLSDEPIDFLTEFAEPVDQAQTPSDLFLNESLFDEPTDQVMTEDMAAFADFSTEPSDLPEAPIDAVDDASLLPPLESLDLDFEELPDEDLAGSLSLTDVSTHENLGDFLAESPEDVAIGLPAEEEDALVADFFTEQPEEQEPLPDLQSLEHPDQADLTDEYASATPDLDDIDSGYLDSEQIQMPEEMSEEQLQELMASGLDNPSHESDVISLPEDFFSPSPEFASPALPIEPSDSVASWLPAETSETAPPDVDTTAEEPLIDFLDRQFGLDSDMPTIEEPSLDDIAEPSATPPSETPDSFDLSEAWLTENESLDPVESIGAVSDPDEPEFTPWQEQSQEDLERQLAESDFVLPLNDRTAVDARPVPQAVPQSSGVAVAAAPTTPTWLFTLVLFSIVGLIAGLLGFSLWAQLSAPPAPVTPPAPDVPPAPSPQASPTPVAPPAPVTPPAPIAPVPPAPVAPPASPTPVSLAPEAALQVALDRANRAITLGQNAQSADDWSLVASNWQQAIGLLQAVPNSNAGYATAQRKVAEYQTYLTVAQQKANQPIAAAAPLGVALVNQPGEKTCPSPATAASEPVILSQIAFETPTNGSSTPASKTIVGCITNNTEQAISSVNVSYVSPTTSASPVAPVSGQLNFVTLLPKRTVPFTGRFAVPSQIDRLTIQSLTWTPNGLSTPQTQPVSLEVVQQKSNT